MPPLKDTQDLSAGACQNNLILDTDDRTFVITLGLVEHGKTYGILLPEGTFFSAKLRSIAEDSLIIFRAD